MVGTCRTLLDRVEFNDTTLSAATTSVAPKDDQRRKMKTRRSGRVKNLHVKLSPFAGVPDSYP